MSNKILILGAAGMAGHMIEAYLRAENEFELFTTSRLEQNVPNHWMLDVFNVSSLDAVIAAVNPDVVINCLGVLVGDSQKNPDKAVFVNAYIPQYLNKLSFVYQYKLIHISTDCVFSGKKGHYVESDKPDESNFYGRSKSLGEVINDKNLTIRTSIIGPELKHNGVGLLHWFLSQQGDIKGFTKVFWAGVTTLELAKFIHCLLVNCSELTGLYHLCNNDKISKCDLLALMADAFHKHDVVIHDDDEFESDKSIINTFNPVNYQVPSYADMMSALAQWMTLNRQTYQSLYKNL